MVSQQYDHNGVAEPTYPHSARSEASAIDSADDLLAKMGYKAELVRTRSLSKVVFMSFVLASIPYGLATTLYYPLQGGGPAVVVWGWVLVSLIILCVAASLGEITSVFPVAGGVYYQTFMLAPCNIRRVAAYICGWAYVVGNITITLAVQFGTTLYFVACINVFEKEPGVPIWEAQTYQIFLIFLCITFLCNAISAFGNRYLPWLDVSLHMRSARCSPHRLSPSLGPSSLSSASWLRFSPSPRTAVARAPTRLVALSFRLDGLPAGRTVLDSFTPRTPPRRLV